MSVGLIWTQTFSTMEKCLESDLRETLFDAEDLGVLKPDQVSYYWAYKKEGMRWINETPEPIDEQQRFQDRPEHYQQEEMS